MICIGILGQDYLLIRLKAILAEAKPGDQLKHVLNPHFGKCGTFVWWCHHSGGHTPIAMCVVYGTPLLTHCLLGAGISESAKLGAGFSVEKGNTFIYTVNCFVGVGNYSGIVWNKHFRICGKTFFVNNSCEFDEQKSFSLSNVLLNLKHCKKWLLYCSCGRKRINAFSY